MKEQKVKKSSAQDLSEKYLKRLNIDYSGKEHTIQFVNELVKKHIATFTFNSIEVLLGKELISLETSDVFHKIVTQGRGGYCFEHNKLLYQVLEELQFKVRPFLGRVLNNRDIDAPRTHRLTLLKLKGDRYLVDVGFGPWGPREAIKFSEIPTVCKGGQTYRINQKEKDQYLLQIFKDGEFATLYSFDLVEFTPSDFLLSHFYSHRHPQAGFVNNLVVSKVLEEEILSLRNRELQVIKPAKTKTTEIESAEHLQKILSTEFDININIEGCKKLYEKK
ncbi:arylamine N-acetyltransferase family protein [Xanthovirga aplysinae]|uniref:arylamine N-acetyltransferase family protein n=1 Tax=Xanthovirga aplysinae TaxID=2529853 RepID=UPI0012BBA461|nr:arylamine N-acetyltransferase [Xanthovirga aplysinae]MTI30467.1 arylamine N-acetyltransferase [Xanthovirga aplysinae]